MSLIECWACIFDLLKVFWPSVILNLPLLWYVGFLVLPQNFILILLLGDFFFFFFTFYVELYVFRITMFYSVLSEMTVGSGSTYLWFSSLIFLQELPYRLEGSNNQCHICVPKMCRYTRTPGCLQAICCQVWKRVYYFCCWASTRLRCTSFGKWASLMQSML